MVWAFAAYDSEPEIQPGITYVDLGPVTAGYNKSFSLDIDQDGDSEFLFTTSLFTDKLEFSLYPNRTNRFLSLRAA